jgi:hypothetical protein
LVARILPKVAAIVALFAKHSVLVFWNADK